MTQLRGIDFAHILSVDPGGTTGLAWQLVSPDAQQRLIHTETAVAPEPVYDLVAEYKWDSVVCERFVTAGRMSKYGLYTIELVGGIKALCYHLGIQFSYRQPQNRKAFQKEAHEHLARLPDRHVIHEEDALAHLLSWKDVQHRMMVEAEAAAEMPVD